MTFIPFDSFDDAMKMMQEMEEAANARLTPGQKAIGEGDHWMQLTRMYGEEIAIFGYVFTMEENRQGEIDAGAEEEELDFTMASLRNAHERGYRFGRAHSIAEVGGELGSTHIADMLCKITPEQFEEARSYDWNFMEMFERNVEWAVKIVEDIRARRLP